jgi:hypothetical protein
MVIEDLANPDEERQVLEALGADMGFAAAQLTNVEKRLSLGEESRNGETHAEGLESNNGALTNNNRYRLNQDQEPTIAMLTVLCLFCFVRILGLLSECGSKLPLGYIEMGVIIRV